jgi:hypothetical protein
VILSITAYLSKSMITPAPILSSKVIPGIFLVRRPSAHFRLTVEGRDWSIIADAIWNLRSKRFAEFSRVHSRTVWPSQGGPGRTDDR